MLTCAAMHHLLMKNQDGYQPSTKIYVKVVEQEYHGVNEASSPPTESASVCGCLGMHWKKSQFLKVDTWVMSVFR